jgi:hypothetical protein
VSEHAVEEKRLVVRSRSTGRPTTDFSWDAHPMYAGGAQTALDTIRERGVKRCSLYHGGRHVAWLEADGTVRRPA